MFDVILNILACDNNPTLHQVGIWQNNYGNEVTFYSNFLANDGDFGALSQTHYSRNFISHGYFTALIYTYNCLDYFSAVFPATNFHRPVVNGHSFSTQVIAFLNRRNTYLGLFNYTTQVERETATSTRVTEQEYTEQSSIGIHQAALWHSRTSDYCRYTKIYMYWNFNTSATFTLYGNYYNVRTTDCHKNVLQNGYIGNSRVDFHVNKILLNNNVYVYESSFFTDFKETYLGSSLRKTNSRM